MTSLRLLRLAAVFAAGIVTSGCGSDGGGSASPSATPTPQPTQLPVVNVVSLDQGWDAATREMFHFTTQGSQILPYDYFLALEQADSVRHFVTDENMERYRYLPAPASELNPDGLPIGFVKHVDARNGSAYLGVTCAACHTSQINYQGTGLRIDGAGTLADFNLMFNDLIDALNATASDDAKFARFADSILGPLHSPSQANALRNDLVSTTVGLAERADLNATSVAPGFARLDAFGVIFNVLLADGLDEPSNARPPSDPVSYPFLWTTNQLDLVQWNGSASNAGLLGPLTRNIGEVIGVFGGMEIKPESKTGYPSTVEVDNLGHIEQAVGNLLSPQWPNQFLPAIDAVKAASGKSVYTEHCSGCHQLIDRSDTRLDISVVMVPADQVGTDPTMALRAATRTGLTGPLEGTPEYIIGGDDFGPTARGVTVLANGVVGVLLNRPFEGLEAAIEEYRRIAAASQFDPVSYKARPLNGIWATAPYLHNGSVPSLMQLMLPPEQRVKTFYVGSREFDPVNVGLVTEPTPGAFLYDTSVAGNSNSGHAYGAGLSDEERGDLIEFLKTL